MKSSMFRWPLKSREQRRATKPAVGTAPTSSLAPDIMLLASANGQRMLALGLRWRAVITSDSKKRDLLRQASRDKATHVVLAPFLMGQGRMGKGKIDSPKGTDLAIYAAGLIAASTAQQDAVFALTLPDGRIWVCQTGGGRPIGQEELMPSAVDASVRVASLRSLNEQLQAWTDIEAVPSRRPYSFEDLMLPPPSPAARVEVVGKDSLLRRLPPSVRMVLGLGLVALVATEAQQWWQDTKRLQEQRTAQALEAAKVEQSRALWQSQVSAYLAGQSLQVDLSALRASLDRVPVIWQGWRLQSAKCTSAAPAQAAKKWACTALYTTPDVKLGQAFDANKRLVVPAGFEADFIPTKEVHLRWVVQTPVIALSAQSLPDKQEHLIGTASLLQMNMAGLANPPELRFAPVDLVQPRHADGAPVLMPADLRLPVKAIITFKGPAAIADALTAGLKADWQSLSLTPAGEKFSGVDIEWTGVVHAKP